MSVERVDFGAGIECQIPTERLREGTKIYMAGPLGFSEVGRPFYAKTIEVVRAMGGDVFDPWQLTPMEIIQPVIAMPPGPEKIEASNRLNKIIAGANLEAIHESTGVFANLDGTDVDSGTAAEIGAAFAAGKPIVGYRGDFRLARDNDGGIVNLQVEYLIRESGGGVGNIITAITQLPRELLRVWG